MNRLFENLTPKQKTLLEFAGVGIGTAIGVTIMWVAVTYGFVFEFAMCMIGYGIYGMLKMLYKSRVEYYTRREKYPEEYR
jgi:hypothetical protein